MKRLLLLVLACVVLAPAPSRPAGSVDTTAPQKVGLAPERLDRIGTALRREIERGTLPGAVVLVARKGKVAYFESFGLLDKATGKPMPKDAIFRVYSMTKPWASVAAMMLMEEGLIELTDPVSKYLPSFKGLQVAVPQKDAATGAVTYNLVPADRQMTIQDLLRHSSGLAYDFVTQNKAVKDAYVAAGLSALDPAFFSMTPAAQVEAFSKAPLAHQPGTTWEYSFATDVLGRVVEVVTGKRLSAFLEERIFQPLQMKDTAFWLPAGKLARVAQPFATDPVTGTKYSVIDPSVEPKNDSGGAGGLSTAADYYRFAQMMANGGRLDGKRLLGPTTVALMTADHLGSRIQSSFLAPGELLMGVPGYTFGLGFMIRQGPGIAGVPGSTGEYMWGGALGTFFWIDPKEELVVVFMSQAGGPIRQYHRRLIKQLVGQAVVDGGATARP